MQRLARSDPVEIVQRLVIAGQQQVVAVIDDEAKRRVGIGPATAAGERRSLMHDDLAPGIEQTHGGAQARNSCADDMDGPGAHGTP